MAPTQSEDDFGGKTKSPRKYLTLKEKLANALHQRSQAIERERQRHPSKPSSDCTLTSTLPMRASNVSDTIPPVSQIIVEPPTELQELHERLFNLSVGPTVRSQGFPLDKHVEQTTPEWYDTGRYFKHQLASIIPSALLSLFEILTRHLYFGSSHKSSSATLHAAQSVRFQTLLEAHGHAGFTAVEKASFSKATGSPTDIRTVEKIFNLNPELTIYACCPLPTCSATYAPISGNIDGGFRYPLRCLETKFGKRCDTMLVGKECTIVNGLSIPKPIKSFAYHHFNDHVASMLSRPGIEKAIQAHMNGHIESDIKDIMSSKAIREFRDSTGQPFLRDVGTELRLVWALCVDWYNPRTNKASGKSISNGVLAMICLSLPPDLRYLEENIYLCGVIPGPQEPSVDAINHFLIPLMNDLVVSYKYGTYYSRTYDHPSGRSSKSAIIPVIADTLASKKVTGHHGHGSAKYFCSRCRLTKDAINNLQPTTWDAGLSREEHECHAEAWRSASSKSKQDSHLKANGIRWSALLLLPYWQPSAWSITEGLHVLLLGVIQRHCRDLLGLNIKDLPSEELLNDQHELPSTEDVARARRVLESGSLHKLRKLSVKLLKILCEEQHMTLPPIKKGQQRRKKDLISQLLGDMNPVSAHHQDTNLGLSLLFTPLATSVDDDYLSESTAVPSQECDESQPSSPMPSVAVITKQKLMKIREQIASTIRPSWQAALPSNFGAPEHGKLKADQWRTAMEFDIPVSLVQLLADSQGKQLGSINHDAHLGRLVENTLDLAMALSWGLSRRTSSYHAERYGFYMQRYLSGINILFPEYSLKPIHHYALHIPDILDLFGPLHGTWAFSTERLIGRLQKFNTNSKIGDMEYTVMNMFCRRSNLVQLVSSDHCPPVLKDAWAKFQTCLNLSGLERGSTIPMAGHNRCSMTSEEESLDEDIQVQLLQNFKPKHSSKGSIHFNGKRAAVLHSYDRGSIRFTDSQTSNPHSLIYFSELSDEHLQANLILRPAQIRQLFRHFYMCDGYLVAEVYAAVHLFTPMVVECDPFRKFLDFRAGIFAREPSPEVTVINVSQIRCHANQRPWNDISVVMRAIDREY